MAETRKEWYIIVNPHAGSGKTMFKWIPSEKRLAELGVKFYTVFTTHKHHAAELAATAARLGYRKIMAVGGDGSIHEVMGGVLGWCETSGVDPSEFYLAVFPIGSGNDWIKAFNIPNDGPAVCDLIAQESFTKQDTVRITFGGGEVSYMANIGGFGFDSHVCEIVNKQKEHGKRREFIYLRALYKVLFTLKPFKAKFVADGKLIYAGNCLSVALGNGSYSGGGLLQCSIAKPDDGILDAVIIPKVSILRIFKEIYRIFNGTMHKCEYLHYVQYKTLEVTPMDEDSADFLEVDGEIEGRLPIKVELLPSRINVLCGKN